MNPLTIGLVAGPFRDRAQRALDSLLRQSIADEIEIHVVDFEPDAESVAAERPGLKVTRAPADWLIGRARAEVARQAQTPLVGFIEEHCVADPEWAGALIDEHADPVVAATAGVIVNLDSEPLLAKLAALCSYRASLPPIQTPKATVLFGQNVCYKRQDLLSRNADLDHYLTTELQLFRDLLAAGRELRVVADARLQHAGLKRYVDVLHGVYHYERAAHGWTRDRGERTGPGGIVKVVLSPLARTLNTVAAETRLHRLPLVTLGLLPFTVLLHSAAATGQLLGRLHGAGKSAAHYSRNELDTARTALPPLEAG